jgi:thioredoxin 1
VALPTTTEAAFAADVLAASSPVLVDFTAEWCPPCRQIAPVLEQLAAEETARMRVVSLDVDANPVVADLYQVTAMPTLVLFVAGREVARIRGVRPGELIRAELEPYLDH